MMRNGGGADEIVDQEINTYNKITDNHVVTHCQRSFTKGNQRWNRIRIWYVCCIFFYSCIYQF
jgi:hypothetical protein